MTTCALTNFMVFFEPSQKMIKFIKNLEIEELSAAPAGILSLTSGERVTFEREPIEYKSLVTDEDFKYLEELKIENSYNLEYNKTDNQKTCTSDKILLNYEDLLWLYGKIQTYNEGNKEPVYLHQLMEGTKLLLPKNKIQPRNPDLEKRCEKLRLQQENEKYMRMTKDVDSVRRRLPEDTVAYQIKHLNAQLVAVFQFVASVLTGFAFGFIGINVFVGELDFGFRLLLGVICALIVALAELYFLAKALNREYDDAVAANSSSDNSSPVLGDGKLKSD